jgi:hypothetical protein
VRDCLNEIRDDADRNLGTPVPWRECLPTAILLLDAHHDDAPALLVLVTYLADWARADATDEANVCAALAAEDQGSGRCPAVLAAALSVCLGVGCVCALAAPPFESACAANSHMMMTRALPAP